MLAYHPQKLHDGGFRLGSDRRLLYNGADRRVFICCPQDVLGMDDPQKGAVLVYGQQPIHLLDSHLFDALEHGDLRPRGNGG